VIRDYVAEYGNLPSCAGPGRDVKLILDWLFTQWNKIFL
jgi:hypothetical protein